jgi:glyoxylase-like metal-dependent hydrolase (beta-lactamase superfamily II)
MDLVPGRPAQVAPGIVRLVAPNPSPLTGPGTNTYLLGDPPVAVLDPGPDDPAHVEAILRLAPRLTTVLVTHTHRDHSPAASMLARRTGARVVGRAPPSDGRQDTGFRADHVPVRDEVLAMGDLELTVIDTPGHASNHVCFLRESDGLLFSGDHVLDGVTPVILAPDGHMGQYLDSLRRLLAAPLQRIAPGHGRVLEDPHAVIEGVIAHRVAREARVLAAVARHAGAGPGLLLTDVYADVPVALHGLARFTLEAHLVKLVEDGRIAAHGEGWRVVDGT